ncbi:hypothetical protein [Kitasatospora sp. GP82]|uniref:hypothetical protein n=1 Tax=Kitasatospora sp. GP82 TaxID=3035089 RepID=UPI00247344F4|nr:hypothetical protein [Kitasatospora sp. GP82]
MNSSARTVVLPALAAMVLLGSAACAAPATAPGATGPAGVSASAPVSAPATAALRTSTDALVVAAAQPGDQQIAVGTPGAAKPAPSSAAHSLRLTAYDPATGTAVLTATGTAPASKSPSPTASSPAAPTSTPPSPTPSSPTPSSPAPAATADLVQPGQLIASPPTPAAPQGALIAVTSAHQAADGTVRATTRPASLAELLGGADADGKVAVDPHAITVKPLVKDLKLSFGQDSGTTRAEASGTLQLDLQTPIPLPGGATADASGSLQLHPTVHFAYHGAAQGSPRTAAIGFDLGAHAQWRISGELARTTDGPVRIPVAELHANPVLTVAGLPVVVNLGLTCFLDISADGKVSMDTEQEYTGAWTVHADYAGGHGWSPVTDTADTKVSPLRAHLSGKASVRAGFGADVSVGLYDAVGVDVTLEPYLRAQVDGSVVLDTSAGAPKVHGTWALYGGIDLTGALLAHLKIFGTPVLDKRLPLPGLHREWPLKTTADR